MPSTHLVHCSGAVGVLESNGERCRYDGVPSVRHHLNEQPVLRHTPNHRPNTKMSVMVRHVGTYSGDAELESAGMHFTTATIMMQP